MSKYEVSLILDNREVKKGFKPLKARIKEILERRGCSIVAARRWEDRKLAYEIKKQKRGTYFLAYVEHDGDGAVLSELERDLTLQDYVLRHMVLSIEEIPENEAELAAKEDDEIANEPEEGATSEDEGQIVVVRERTAADNAPPPAAQDEDEDDDESDDSPDELEAAEKDAEG